MTNSIVADERASWGFGGKASIMWELRKLTALSDPQFAEFDV